MINSEFIKNLNSAQKEAVTHLDGPLLIVAGAGSGKTKVLTSRIVNLIKEKKLFQAKYWQSPSQIKQLKKCRIE